MFNLAKSFSASTRKLSTADRGRVLDFLTKFMDDPSSPGLNFETIRGAQNSDMKSARITQDLRTILHSSDGRHTLLYAAHHDEAYRWAERHRVQHHEVTGALQIVESSDDIELSVPESAHDDPSWFKMPKLLADFDDDYLLSLGVPSDWLLPLRQVQTEDQLLEVATRLPEETAERILAVAAGDIVTPPPPVDRTAPIEQNPDNLRRFWVVEDAADLVSVLDRPIEDWVRFLHPSQRQLVTAEFRGPAKVSGAAGTGKTVVGMHRARALAANGKRVLLTSYVTTLCRNIERNIKVLCGGLDGPDTDISHRIKVSTVHKQALDITKDIAPQLRPADDTQINKLIDRFHLAGDFIFDTDFLKAEWHGVLEPQAIRHWDEYRDAARTGRGKPLSVKQRKQCWNVYERVLQELSERDQQPWSLITRSAREALESGQVTSPFDAVIVDEVQDLQPESLRFLAALAADNPGDLMLLGDTGQRIYPGGFSLKRLGIDVRGRSTILRINYRTTEQIRQFADSLLDSTSDDFDEGQEDRRSRSLLRGPTPVLHGFNTDLLQYEFVTEQIRRIIGEGVQPQGVAVFARSNQHLKGIRTALTAADIPHTELKSDEDPENSLGVNLGTMHRAKGLEFKVVFVIDCQDDVIPHAYTLSKLTDPADFEAGMDREKQLLYVAITRARDEAFVTWTGAVSRFLEAAR